MSDNPGRRDAAAPLRFALGSFVAAPSAPGPRSAIVLTPRRSNDKIAQGRASRLRRDAPPWVTRPPRDPSPRGIKGVRTLFWGVELGSDAEMGRPKRADEASGIYHAWNQGNARSAIFQKPEVCRYVERNDLRAGLVRRAEDWRDGVR
jgi:hypothetical protein